MVFAFNCVTVLLILVEVFRCKYGRMEGNEVYYVIARQLDGYFSSFCDGREGQGKLIVTHIYLLIGCTFAPTLAFILVDGGFITNELCIVGLSGVLFLGVGDTTAALYGSTYGRATWSKKSNKTTQGTWACIIAVCITYYLLLCMHENPFFKGFFMVIAFATFLTSIIEGTTYQFDNLVCPIAFVVIMMHLFDMFFSIN